MEGKLLPQNVKRWDRYSLQQGDVSMKKKKKKDDSTKRALPRVKQKVTHLHNSSVGNMVSRETNVRHVNKSSAIINLFLHEAVQAKSKY